MADSRNVSYTLNSFGPWADQLLAGIGGSAAKLNYYEPIESALPIIRNAPGAFRADFLFQNAPQAPTPPPSGTPTETPSATKDDSWRIRERITSILGGHAGIIESDIAGLPSKETVARYFLYGTLAFILIVFGLWILLYPTTKEVIKDVVAVAK